MPSPFDTAWESANAALDCTAGEWVTVNGRDVRATVSTLESSSRGIPGLNLADNRTQVDLTAEDAIACGVAKGKIVLAQDKRLRIMAVHNNGGAGVTLMCEAEEQSSGRW